LEPVFGGSATKGNRVFGKNRSIEGVQSGAKKPSKCSRSQPTVSEPTAVAEDASMAMDELRVPQTTPTQELDAEQPVDAEMLAADSAATGRGRSKSKSKKPSAAPAQVERESSRSRQAAPASIEPVVGEAQNPCEQGIGHVYATPKKSTEKASAQFGGKPLSAYSRLLTVERTAAADFADQFQRFYSGPGDGNEACDSDDRPILPPVSTSAKAASRHLFPAEGSHDSKMRPDSTPKLTKVPSTTRKPAALIQVSCCGLPRILTA